ncbi:solute symporter family protein [Burkholderia anthina]|uniref:solute symporter family protein n=1 Tax=Burkholderia anthina TaxID=179879 RepID=UPI00158B8705|nr:cation acetate symporter [Burkholderia anthina]
MSSFMSAGGVRIVAFSVFIILSLLLTSWASRRSKGAAGFFVAGRNLSPRQNGLAISGDFMSAASFLGVTGLVALFGFDGLVYQVGFIVGWLMIMLIVAEPVRNCGKYTLSDVVALRLHSAPVRGATAVSSLLISLAYLLAQLVGAGALASLLLPIGTNAAIILIGVLMIAYVLFGGMVGATYVQIVKAVLVWSAAAVLLVLALAHFSFDVGAMFSKAKAAALYPDHYLIPGAYLKNPVDTISLAVALALGTAGLPHVMTRFYTVPSAVDARDSAKIALVVMTTFAVMVCLLGFAAAAIVGPQSILQSNKAGNSAITLLAVTLGGGVGSLGGELLLACVSAIAFATILAVVSGIMISSASTIAHDIFAMLVFRSDARDKRQVQIAKVATVTFGAVAICLALAVKSLNVAFLVGLAFAIAASANLPVVLMTLYWRRFTDAGAVAAVVAGAGAAIGLVMVGPAVMGSHGIIFKTATPLISLANPGIVSIPIGFFAGWIVSLLTSQKRTAIDAFEEQQLRMLSGYGAEEALPH